MLFTNRHDENITTENLSEEHSDSSYIDISLTSHEESVASSISSLTASFQESSPLLHAPIPSHVSFELVEGVDNHLLTNNKLGSTKANYCHMKCKQLVNNPRLDLNDPKQFKQIINDIQHRNNYSQRKYRTSRLIGGTTKSSCLPQSVTQSLASYEESALNAVMNANRSILRRYEHRYHPKSQISNFDMTPPMSSLTAFSQDLSSSSHTSLSSCESSELVKEVNDLLENVSQTSSREKEITNKLRLMKMKYYHLKCKQLVKKARADLNEPKQYADDMIKRCMNKDFLEMKKGSRNYRTSKWIGDTTKGCEERGCEKLIALDQ